MRQPILSGVILGLLFFCGGVLTASVADELREPPASRRPEPQDGRGARPRPATHGTSRSDGAGGSGREEAIGCGIWNMPLSEVDMLIVWASILCCVVAIWQHYRRVAVAMGAGQP
jgi:hypothetical protein